MKKCIGLILSMMLLIGCAAEIGGYPVKDEGTYVIDSINAKTAYYNESVEITVNGLDVQLYSRNTSDNYDNFYYSVSGGEKVVISCLDDKRFKKSFIAYSSYTTDSENVIGLVQVASSKSGSYMSPQEYIENDVLFKLNPYTGENEIFYETKDNSSRIVGYNEGAIYLYENNSIYEYYPDNGKKDLLKEISPFSELTFSWNEDGLSISNEKENYHEFISIG